MVPLTSSSPGLTLLLFELAASAVAPVPAAVAASAPATLSTVRNAAMPVLARMIPPLYQDIPGHRIGITSRTGGAQGNSRFHLRDLLLLLNIYPMWRFRSAVGSRAR